MSLSAWHCCDFDRGGSADGRRRPCAHEDQVPANPITTISVGRDQTAATKVTDNIYQAIGFGNTFMVTTPAGNVIIDTSIAFNTALHTKLLRAVSDAPVKYIILTHAHGDHTGGVEAWRKFGGPDTQIIAQRNHVEFQHYQTRLKGFYDLRNAAQFGRPMSAPGGDVSGQLCSADPADDPVRRPLRVRTRRRQLRGAEHAGRNLRSCDSVDAEGEGRLHWRQLLRLVSQHIHAARDTTALGARLCSLVEQGARIAA